MNKVANRIFVTLIAAAALPLGAAGCFAQPSNDPAAAEGPVGTTAEAFDSTCVSANPDKIFLTNTTTPFASPASYNNPGCFKSEMIWVEDLDVSTTHCTGHNNAGFIAFEDNGSFPSTDAECDALRMEILQWHWDDVTSTWVADNGGNPYISYGFVDLSGECFIPAVTLSQGNQVLNGVSYSFAVTNRVSWPSGATRSFKVTISDGQSC